jgi:hypothetical protein
LTFGGLGQPLSDAWDHPDVQFLCAAPWDPYLVVAGCDGALYVSDPTAPDPMETWTEIALPPWATVAISGTFLASPERFVVGTDNGIWSTAVAGLQSPAWAQATVERVLYGGKVRKILPFDYPTAGLAPTVVGIAAGAIEDGIYSGSWIGNELRVVSAGVSAPGWATVASSPAFPSVAYALLHTPDGKIAGVLRSTDGGRTYEPRRLELMGKHASYFDTVFEQGDIRAGGRLRRITVSPADPNRIGIGGLRGLVSTDGGDTVRVLGGEFSDPNTFSAYPWVHPDVHVVAFDAHDPLGRRIFVGSDGGVLKVENLGLVVGDYSTGVSRSLRNLQFLASGPTRGFWGTVAGHPADVDVVAGGLQDNGTVWATMEPISRPWHPVDGGDGGFAGFLPGVETATNLRGSCSRTQWANRSTPTGGILREAITAAARPSDKRGRSFLAFRTDLRGRSST